MSEAWIVAIVLISVWAAIVVGANQLLVWLTFRKASPIARRKISIDVDTNMYVDEVIGSDDNDGLSWAKAKKTCGFLQGGGVLNANLKVVVRRDPSSPNGPCIVPDWAGPGSMRVVSPALGEETAEQAVRDFHAAEREKGG